MSVTFGKTERQFGDVSIDVLVDDEYVGLLQRCSYDGENPDPVFDFLAEPWASEKYGLPFDVQYLGVYGIRDAKSEVEELFTDC